MELRATDAEGRDTSSRISEPARLVRIGSMLGSLQRQLRELDDEADREQLLATHRRVRGQLEDMLSGGLAEELDAVIPPLPDEPTAGELRVAHAQLTGWVEGLLRGIQTAVQAQQRSAEQALRQRSGAAGPPG